MRERTVGRGGWIAALLVVVIGMPTTAVAATIIDGKYIKTGTVKAKQLDPIQRSEAWSFEVPNADLPLSSSPSVVAYRDLPQGSFVVNGAVVVSNLSGSSIAVACYLDDDSETAVFRGHGGAAEIASGGTTNVAVLQTARVNAEVDAISLKCFTLGNPVNVEMEGSFMVATRVAKIANVIGM